MRFTLILMKKNIPGPCYGVHFTSKPAMKKRTTPFKLGVLTYLLFLPIFLLTNCQNEFDEPILNSEVNLNRNLEVLLLMKAAVVSDSDDAAQNKSSASKSMDPAGSDQCTQFQYPMTFDVYSGEALFRSRAALALQHKP